MHTSGFNPDIFQKIFEDGEPPSGVEIATDIVALARMSAGNPNPVHAPTKGLQNVIGFHAPGTGNANDPDIGRIGHSPHPGQIRGPVRTPIAQKSRNARFKCLIAHKPSLCEWEIPSNGASVQQVTRPNSFLPLSAKLVDAKEVSGQHDELIHNIFPLVLPAQKADVNMMPPCIAPQTGQHRPTVLCNR
jgi:hypothetical protein